MNIKDDPFKTVTVNETKVGYYTIISSTLVVLSDLKCLVNLHINAVT